MPTGLLSANNEYEIVIPVSSQKSLPHQLELLPDELQYSYLLRLAFRHGYSRITSFLSDYGSSHTDKWRNYVFPPYDCCKNGLDLGLSIPGDDFFLRTSVYPALSPIMTWGSSARYISNLYNERKQGNFRAVANYSLIDTLKRCPVCWQEDIKQYGTPYYHRMHNIPGVTVCAVHGCALEDYCGEKGGELTEPSFKTTRLLPNAKAYADFAKVLLDERFEGSVFDMNSLFRMLMRDTYKIMNDQIFRNYPIESWMNSYSKGNNIQQTFNFIYTQNRNFTDYVSIIAVLLSHSKYIHSNKHLLPSGMEDAFKATLEKFDFKLISQYRDSFVRLRCNKCGTVFASTPHAIVTGMGCPHCTANMNNEEYYLNQFTFSTKDYIPLSPIKSIDEKIKVLDKHKGKEFNTTFDRMINFGCYEGQHYNVEIHYKKDYDSVADNRFTILQCPDFFLESYSRRKGQVRLELYHKVCHKSFEVGLWDFKRQPFCRCCEKTKVQKFKDKVKSESNDTFACEMESFDPSGDVTVIHKKSGIEITGSAEYVIDRIRAIMRNPKHLTSKRINRNKEKNIILSRIQQWKDDIIFTEDFRDVSDGRYVSSLLSQLSNKGMIESIAPGAFVVTGTRYTEDRVLYEKYAKRHGKRIGIDVKTPILRFSDLPFENIKKVYAVNSDEKFFSDAKKQRFMDTEFFTYASPVEINQENYKLLRILFFIYHMNKTTSPELLNDIWIALYDYVKTQRIKRNKLKRYEKYFPFSVGKIVSNMYAGLFNEIKNLGLYYAD